MPDYDERLVDLYDEDNPDGPDHDFYRGLADERGAASVLDLGCGTGILTVTFATHDRTVVGIDPSATMLDYARRRPGAGRVHWVHGDSRDIPGMSFDLAVMTGNVAQHIPDPAWGQALRGIRTHLNEGDTLTFESRNPARRAWEGWQSHATTTRDTPHGPLTEWSEIRELVNETVEVKFHNRFERTGDTVTEVLHLVFRDRETLTTQLDAAGFEIEAVYGDWGKTPFDLDHPLLVMVARAR